MWVYWGYFPAIWRLFLIAASASQPAIIALLFSSNKNFRFTLVHSLFNILREIFLTSLG